MGIEVTNASGNQLRALLLLLISKQFWSLVNAALLLLWGSLYTPIRVKQIHLFYIQISILLFLRNITTGQKPLVKKQPVTALLSAS